MRVWELSEIMTYSYLFVLSLFPLVLLDGKFYYVEWSIVDQYLKKNKNFNEDICCWLEV
jgi:hypothetical protein